MATERITVSASQIWYLAHVFPEIVSHEEAAELFSGHVTEADDRSYWEQVAARINDHFSSEYPPLRSRRSDE